MARRGQRANKFSGPDLLRYFILIALGLLVLSIFMNESNKRQTKEIPELNIERAKPDANSGFKQEIR